MSVSVVMWMYNINFGIVR